MPTSRPTPGAADVWGAQLNAWLDENFALKANDADVMKLTGDQTAAGIKTFTSDLTVNGQLKLGAVVLAKGTGSPEGVVAAPVGSLFFRTDGGTGTSLYRKESGTGNTGWATSGAPTGTAGGDLTGTFPNPTIATAPRVKRDGWTYPGELIVGPANKFPHRAMRPETLTGNFVAEVGGTAPLGQSIILDLLRYVGGTGTGTSVFATTDARPTIAAGTKVAVVGALGITAIAANDTLVPDIIQTGSTAAQVVRLLGSSDSGLNVTAPTGVQATIPFNSATPTTGEKMTAFLVLGGDATSLSPLPLTIPAGWEQTRPDSAVFVGGTNGLTLVTLTKEAAASESTTQVIGFSGGNRPWALAVVGVTNSVAGVEGLVNEAGAYTSAVTTAAAPEAMPSTNNAFNGTILNVFAMRVNGGAAGTTTGVTGAPHANFTELVDRDSSRPDNHNVGVEVSWRPATAGQAATPVAERTLTLTLTGGPTTGNVIASTVVAKRAAASGSDLTFEFEFTT